MLPGKSVEIGAVAEVASTAANPRDILPPLNLAQALSAYPAKPADLTALQGLLAHLGRAHSATFVPLTTIVV